MYGVAEQERSNTSRKINLRTADTQITPTRSQCRKIYAMLKQQPIESSRQAGGGGTMKGAEHRSVKSSHGTQHAHATNHQHKNHSGSHHGSSHIVKSGDTLIAIANRARVNWQDLARANGITNPSALKVGAVLTIPAASSRPHAPTVPAHPTGSIARPTQGQRRLGDLSMRFETGFRPGQEGKATAKVSSGRHDPGGVSYGAYQLASTAKGGHQVQAFLKAEGRPWAQKFHGLDPTISGGEFETKWKEVAASDPKLFFEAQHAYIEKTHYTPVLEHISSTTGLDISQRSRTVQNVVWSMAVQHGRAARLVEKAVIEVGPQGSCSDNEYDIKLINKLYDIRSDYADKIHQSNLKNRYIVEKRSALAEIPKGSK